MSAKTHISDYLLANAASYPDKAALIFGNQSLSWSQLAKRAEAVAAYLSVQIDSSEQQVVGLLMPNGVEYIVAYLGIVWAGHIAMPLDVIYKSLELNAIVGQIPPTLIISDEANLGRIGPAGKIIINFNDIPTNQRPGPYLRLPAKKQIASLVFTSGTTGKPKAAPYTHANHLWNIGVCSRAWGWHPNDSLLISLRLSHWYGLVMGLSGVLYHGNTLYLQDGFDAKRTLEVLSTGKITFFTHTPFAYGKILAEKQIYDLSGVRLFVSGSAPLPPKIWKAFKQKYGTEIAECYGSSETGRIAANPLSKRLSGSPGRVLPGVKIKFSRQAEVLVKSPGVFPGYFKNPSATRAGQASGGWWRTGDKGKLVNGRLILQGRLTEYIRKRGYIISPRDIEWALHKCQGVQEVHVLGLMPSPGEDSQITCFIVTKLGLDEIKSFSLANLPSIWRPDKIIGLDYMPRTSTGKVSITRLRAMLN